VEALAPHRELAAHLEAATAADLAAAVLSAVDLAAAWRLELVGLRAHAVG
jgi:hypothetical protein